MRESEYIDRVGSYLDFWRNDQAFGNDYLHFKKTIASFEAEIIGQIVRLLESYSPECRFRHVLDIGCGDGVLTHSLLSRLRPNTAVYTGIDCNARSLRNHVFADNRSAITDIRLIHGDVNTFDLHTKFDLIVALNSAYGLTPETLCGLPKMLSKNGLTILTVNSEKGLFHRLSQCRDYPLISAENVVAVLQKNALRYACHECRYKIPKPILLSHSFSYLTQEQSPAAAGSLNESPCEEIETIIIIQRLSASQL